jgi:hypothetical protein
VTGPAVDTVKILDFGGHCCFFPIWGFMPLLFMWLANAALRLETWPTGRLSVLFQAGLVWLVGQSGHQK